jgi:hypothetical protein
MDGTDGVTEIEGALTFFPLAGEGALLTEMLGMSGVTEIDGILVPRPLLGAEESLTDILGMGGVTPIDGTFAPRPLPGLLIDIEGVSEIDIVGIVGTEAG